MTISLKAKLSIWYLTVMLFLSTIFFTGMYYVLKETLHDKEYTSIKEESYEATHYISVENGNVKIVGNYLQNFIDHGGFAAIYDIQGNLLAGKLPGDATFNKESNFEEIIMVTARDARVKYIVVDTQLKLNNMVLGWFRLVKIQYFEKAIADMFSIYALFIPIYIGFAVLGGLFLTTKALSPVSKIISTAKAISSGNLSIRIRRIGGKDEVGQLSQSIDNMMDIIESAYNRQKQFTQDASHELRTPITVIMTTAEEALSSAETTEDFREALCLILEKGNVMRSLIMQLLLIGKGFEENFKPEQERIDLSLTTQVMVDELSNYASGNGISLHKQIEESLFVNANQTLLTRLMINLIENAIKYNRHGGNVWLSVVKKKNYIHLTIKDDGIGISEKDLPFIWERFYKAERSRGNSGTGLGLAMVMWIANIHGWKINVKSEIELGSCFEVLFPIENKNDAAPISKI